MARPDLSALTLPELTALRIALHAAVEALEGAGGAGEAALYSDDETDAVTLTVTIPYVAGAAGGGV